MSYEILKRELKQGITRGLYLFFGPEEYLIKHYTAEIEKLIVEPSAKDVSLTLFDGKADPGAVYDACSAFPMFGGRRLVVLNNCGIFKQGAQGADGSDNGGTQDMEVPRARDGGTGGGRRMKTNAITYGMVVDNLPDFTCLLIIERDIDRRLSLLKQIAAGGLVVEFAYRSHYELEDWVRAVAGRDGRQFTRDALIKFVSYAGESMTRLKTELDKLLMYTAGKKGVTSDDVDAVCVAPLNAKIFDLLDNALAGQKKLALIQLDLLLREREPAMRILSTLSNHIILLRQIKYLADGGAKLPYATKLLGLNPYRAEKLWRQSARVTPRTLSRAAEICHAQDMAVKRGIIGDVSALQSVVSGI